MQEIIGALSEQQDELSTLLAPLDDEGWERPSRCEGWTVADVVLHLAQTNEMAIGSAQDTFLDTVVALSAGIAPTEDVDAGAAAMVAKDRHVGAAAIHARWQASVDGMRDALLARQPSDRVTWVAGELSVRTLATTRLAETWIHTGDVMHAFEIAPQPASRLQHIARLAWRTLPYAFARSGRELHGPVAFELDGPDGERWVYADDGAVTTIRGSGLELCLVAGRRAEPSETSLRGEGPDADTVLALVRTYA